MRLAGNSAWGVGALLLLGCGGGSLPQARVGENESEETRNPDSDAASIEAPSTEGPCPDAPQVEVVIAQAKRASDNAREVDEYLKQLGQPPMPPAPYTVARAEKWIDAVGQPWFFAQATRVKQFEQALDAFPEGTYGRARATITVAAAWEYLSKRRAQVPKEAQKKYDVRVAYYGDWPHYEEQSLSERARAWVTRARRAASEWGMFQVGVDRFWLTGNAKKFLREPFPAPSGDGFASQLLPASVSNELNSPGWPKSAEEVLELGAFGLTPRQLACAQRFETDPRVRHVLGRYHVTRALLFRDGEAAHEAERLLASDTSPAAVVDRGLLMWLKDHDETGGGRTYDNAQVRGLFELLPPGDLSRRRFALNLIHGYGSVPAIADVGPPEEQLPQGEQRSALRHFDSGFQHRESRDDFPWWTPLVSQPGNDARPIQGVRVDLSDGSHFIIPYSDQGLDHCAMVHIAENGQRSPHRPPDLKKKCASRWVAEDGN